MAELELTRSSDDRRLYVLESLGTVRLEGLFARSATIDADGRRLHVGRTGLFGRRVVATDQAGAEVGRFQPRDLGRGGTLRWAGGELSLRPASAWRQRYALAQGEAELALLDGKGWGKRPAVVSIGDPASVKPAILLFAAFVVRGLAEDSGAGAATVSSTSATAG